MRRKICFIVTALAFTAALSSISSARTPKVDEWGFANCEDGTFVNVRYAPDITSPVVGLMERATQADVIGEEDGWLEIVSGDVRGFVADYLLETGDEAVSLEKSCSRKVACANKDTTAYAEPNPESEAVFWLESGRQYNLASTMDGWVLITNEGQEGFVKFEDVTLRTELKKAMVVELTNSEIESYLDEEPSKESEEVEYLHAETSYVSVPSVNTPAVTAQATVASNSSQEYTKVKETETEALTEAPPETEAETTASESETEFLSETEEAISDISEDEPIYDADKDEGLAPNADEEDPSLDGDEEIDETVFEDSVEVIDLDTEGTTEAN